MKSGAHVQSKQNTKQQGYTIGEMLIVLVIGGVCAVGAASLASRLGDMMESSRTRADAMLINETIMTAMGSMRSCKAMFQTAPPFNPGAASTLEGMPIQLVLPGADASLGPIRDWRLRGSATPQILAGYRVGVMTAALTHAKQVATAGGEYYSVNLMMGYSPVRAGKVKTSPGVGLRPQIVGSMTVKIEGGVISECGTTGAVTDPVVYCSQLVPPRIYVKPNAQIVGYAGNGGERFYPANEYAWGVVEWPGYAPAIFTADGNGCVDAAAFQAPPAPPGFSIMGDRGPKGPDAPPAPQGPPGPPGNPSDRRLKQNVQAFNYGLKELNKIRPIWFEYNGLAGTTAGEKHAGVIAQELEAVAPKLVAKARMPLKPGDEETEVRSVRYDDFRILLIRSIQEQQKEIDELASRLERMSAHRPESHGDTRPR
jgi:prepilin-type N-terminal cleavage/methylation domain-containing protein